VAAISNSLVSSILQRLPTPPPQKLPYVVTEFGDARIPALIDTGTYKSFITEEAYKSIIATGYAPFKVRRTFEVHFEIFKWSIFLVTKKVLFEFKINGDVFQHTFRLTAGEAPILLGETFLQQYQFIIDFHEECFHRGEKGGRTRYGFSCPTGENVGEYETNGGQPDHTTNAPLPGIHSTQPSPRTQPDSHAEPTPLPSRQKPELEKNPYKVIEFRKTKVLAAFDTGAQESAIPDKAYKSIVAAGYKTLLLPVKPAKFISGKKIKKLTTKVLLEFNINGHVFQHHFWVVEGMQSFVLLGEDFLRENRMALDFREKCLRFGDKENNIICEFTSTKEIEEFMLHGNGNVNDCCWPF
jgi:hypothetical protein